MIFNLFGQKQRDRAAAHAADGCTGGVHDCIGACKV